VVGGIYLDVRSATSSGAAKLVTPQDAAGFARVIPSRRHDQGSPELSAGSLCGRGRA